MQIFNESVYNALMHNWTRPDGCKDRILDCQEALKEHGPLVANGIKKNYTEICGDFLTECGFNAVEIYQGKADGRGWYDIGHSKYDPFPAPHLYGYLTEGEVLSSLGVPVNYSESSGAVGISFQHTFGKMVTFPFAGATCF